MKKFLITSILALSVVVSAFAEVRTSLVFHGGYNYNMNYRDAMGYTNTNALPDFNAGAQGLIYLGKRFRLGVDLEYYNISFTRKYNFINPTESSIDYTQMAINNVGANPNIDFRLFSMGKLDLYATTSLQLEFSITDYQKNTLLNGNTSTTRYIKNDYSKFMTGANGGFILNYNISKNIALSLTPKYTYFFEPFYPRNDYDFQRLGMNFGVEWKF
jgi:hypothetical protein